MDRQRFRDPLNEDRPYMLRHDMAEGGDPNPSLDALHKAGFGGIVTNADWHTGKAKKYFYLEKDADFARLDEVIRTLQKRGMGVWLYDECGYPSGAANGLTLEWVDYFEVCALNEQAMIREFLAMDEKMPAPLTKLEADVKEAAWPRIYAMTTRSSQQLLGVFRALSKAQGGVLEVFDENDLPKAESLREQLNEWLDKTGADEDAALEIRMADRNENSWFFTENG